MPSFWTIDSLWELASHTLLSPVLGTILIVQPLVSTLDLNAVSESSAVLASLSLEEIYQKVAGSSYARAGGLILLLNGGAWLNRVASTLALNNSVVDSFGGPEELVVVTGGEKVLLYQ